MNMFVRLVILGIKMRLGRKLDLLGTGRTRFRVRPTDLDVLGHMNNGVYFSIFDLARVDLMTRSGLFAQLNKNGWYGVVTTQTGTFRRSLKPFRRFEIDTRIIGWDDRHLYFEHAVTCGGKLTTSAVIQVRFLSRSGERIDPQRLVDTVAPMANRPNLPDWVEQWAKSTFEHAKAAA